MKKYPITKIEQGQESVVIVCEGKNQTEQLFVVCPLDVKKIQALSSRLQEHIVKTPDGFIAFLRPRLIAKLRSWADLVIEDWTEKFPAPERSF